MSSSIRVLFLAANSSADNRRYLEQEIREIDRRIRSGGVYRDSFDLLPNFSVRPQDLQALLLRHQPHIVHFSGHGNEAQGMVLQDETPHAKPVESTVFAELFRLLKGDIRIIIFNACYAEEQAKQLDGIVDFTIGMSGIIEAQARVEFSAAFYHALTYNRSVAEAFALARSELRLQDHPDFQSPKLMARRGADDSSPFAADLLAVDSESAPVIEHVRRLSEIAARDARFIIEDTYGTMGGAVRLDQNLYVHRKVERWITNALDSVRSTSAFLLVVGEAGHGKTSLLWYLHDQLGKTGRWEPWFIKSTLFLGRQETQLTSASNWTRFDPESLLQAVRRKSGPTPVVLLDTVDLLLRDATDRDFVLELVMSVIEQGGFVIASCRPQESVLLQPGEPLRFTLREYDANELQEAVAKHTERFYAASIRYNYADESSRVLAAVARGLPIREVCANPLTLRMLFTIYAPAAIPDDINIFELYKQYWASRVLQDYRAGSPIAPIKTANLETTTTLVALVMLAEGTPELDLERLHDVLKARPQLPEEINMLVSRGVLHVSEVGTISFFHQTFFEHGAARGLLALQGAAAGELLYARMQSRPHDLFIAAIYEQALLLPDGEGSRALKLADNSLIELLQSDSLPFKSSGVYVYAHRRTITPAVAEAMATLLAKAEESLVVRFLTLAPNICDQRLKTLFLELDVIWQRKNWREHEHLLKLLERLVPRDFESVKSFIEKHELLNYLVTRPVGFTGDRKLLRLLTTLAECDPAWSLRRLTDLYIKAIPQTHSRDLQAAVVETLLERPALFGPQQIATQLEAETAHLDLDSGRNFAPLTLAWGGLLNLEWQARGRSVESVLKEISEAPAGLRLMARIRALALMLLATDEREAKTALAYFKAEVGTPREWLWPKLLWPYVLAGTDAERQDPHGNSAAASVQYIRNEFKRALAEEAAKLKTGAGPDRYAQTLRTAMREASLTDRVLLELLDVPELAEAGLWLDPQTYAVGLVDAFLAGHVGAVLAMKVLTDDPEPYWESIATLVGSRFTLMIAKGGMALDTALTLALKVDDEVTVLRALEQATEPIAEAFQVNKDQLTELRLRLMKSRSARSRLTGVLIWSHLLRLGLAATPDLSELLEYFEHEDDARMRGQVITLMADCGGRMSLGVDEVFEILKPLAGGGDINIRDLSLKVLARLVASDSSQLVRLAPRLLDLALAAPTNAARLSVMRPLVEKLIAMDVEVAAQVLTKLLTEARSAGLGINGSRKLLGRFKATVRRLVRVAPQAVRQSLLNIVPELDRVLGVLIIDALCHHGLSSMTGELESLIASNIHSDVKEVILRYKYFYERTLGGEDWPELLELIQSALASLVKLETEGQRRAH
jgi:hypothetical protein